MTFTATLLLGGKTATGFAVPDEVVAALASGKRPKVYVTVNGHTYRSSVGAMDGQYMVGVSAADRAAAGLVAGDTADIELRLDTDVREVDRAPDFTDALNASPRALAELNTLSYSRQRWFALNIEAAKTPATRARRVDQAIRALESDDGGRTA